MQYYLDIVESYPLKSLKVPSFFNTLLSFAITLSPGDREREVLESNAVANSVKSVVELAAVQRLQGGRRHHKLI